MKYENGATMERESEYLWQHPTTNQGGLIRIAAELITALLKTPEPPGYRESLGQRQEFERRAA